MIDDYINKIICGDCLEVMKGMPDKCVDLIVTDPPYGMTACEWDIAIPLKAMWRQFKRIIKDNGAITMTAVQPFTSKLIMSNYNMFRYELIYEKSQSTRFLDVKKRPLNSHENILIYYKNQPTYNPQKTYGHEPVNHGTRRANHKIRIYGKDRTDYIKSFGGSTERYPRSVLKFVLEDRLNSIHPTRKPVKLCQWLISTYTNPADIIFDPFSGSGTTAVAAKELNRKYICIELDPKYCKIAEERLRQEVLGI